ncbi:hypothetical protein, partial [Aureivirga sp. CE67]|uniref:hypothetical protein n=1 Tax=Aureivirga sp. CE67 TaxID=1788983 RepID=UPI0018C9557E
MKQKLLFLCFLFSFLNQYAQEWQWLKRGGGQLEPDNNIGYYSKEGVLYMDTDKNGNLYILSPLTQFNIDLDGIALESENNIANGKSALDFVIASYDCDGNYRWSNVIGGPSGEYDFSMQIDNEGNSYLTGIISSSPFKLTDEVYGNTGANERFMIKYDSEGEVLWYKSIQENEDEYINYASHIIPKQIIIDKENEKLFVVQKILKGTYGNGQLTVEEAEDGKPRFYLFEYNLDGEFQNAVKLDLRMWGYAEGYRISKFARDPNTGNIYLAGFAAGYYYDFSDITESEVVFGED